MKQQKGMSTIAAVAAIFLGVILISLLIKLVPVYYEYMVLKNAFNQAAQEVHNQGNLSENRYLHQFRKLFKRQLIVENIKLIDADDVELNESKPKQIILNYEVKKHFIANVSLLIEFNLHQSIKS